MRKIGKDKGRGTGGQEGGERVMRTRGKETREKVTRE